MKKRIGTSILLALALLLIPSMALAGDPPDVDVDIGITTGGDVDVDLGINAGGDVDIDVGTNGDVSVNGDGLATQDDVSNAIGNFGAGSDDWMIAAMVWEMYPEFQEWKKKVGNDMFHDLQALFNFAGRKIQEDNLQDWALSKVERKATRLEAELDYSQEYIKHLESVMVYNEAITSNQIAMLEYELEQEIAVAKAESQRNLFQVKVGFGVALLILFAVVVWLCRRMFFMKKYLP